jgi:hypothetical protein
LNDVNYSLLSTEKLKGTLEQQAKELQEFIASREKKEDNEIPGK